MMKVLLTKYKIWLAELFKFYFSLYYFIIICVLICIYKGIKKNTFNKDSGYTIVEKEI